MRIDLSRTASRPFQATLHGRRQELTNASLARALVRYPLMPQRVISLIHLQAVKLWLKRVPFFHKPPFVPGEGSVDRERGPGARSRRARGAGAGLAPSGSSTALERIVGGTIELRLPDGLVHRRLPAPVASR